MNILINKAKTACVSGHRFLDKNLDLELVKEKLSEMINDGYDTFLVGMALGFDTACFKILSQIKKEKNIKIIACIPCKNQCERFNLSQKKEYYKMVESADESIILSKTYTQTCMIKRNEFMVDNSSCVLAYLRKKTGGTAYTVKYAISKNIKVLFV